jgi:hypothetical protein
VRAKLDIREHGEKSATPMKVKSQKLFGSSTQLYRRRFDLAGKLQVLVLLIFQEQIFSVFTMEHC